MRYDQILAEIKRIKASRLLEIGTWNGDRAMVMMDAALSAGVNPVVYHGFDLFEDITPEKSEEEFNVKASAREGLVLNRLLVWGRHKNAEFAIHRGDTRETLPQAAKNLGKTFDLIWLDGGHSVETIASDWAHCLSLIRPGGVILLDDYYSGMEEAKTRRFGCNTLVGTLEDAEILPVKDPVQGGGWVQIVKVTL